MWKEKHARTTRDAALKDIEASFNRVVALEDRLSESERLLQMMAQHRDATYPLDLAQLVRPDYAIAALAGARRLASRLGHAVGAVNQ